MAGTALLLDRHCKNRKKNHILSFKLLLKNAFSLKIVKISDKSSSSTAASTAKRTMMSVVKSKADKSTSVADTAIRAHCLKSSFYVQKFNFYFLRKIVKKNLGEKLVKTLGFCK